MCQLDAQLTAEAGNALIDSKQTDAEVETAKEKASEAVTVRLIIDKIAEMRDPECKFEYKEPQKMPATTQPPQE